MARLIPDEDPRKPRQKPAEGDTAIMQAAFDAVARPDRTGEKAAAWDKLIEWAEKNHNLGHEAAEEAINSLFDAGLWYEPLLGTLKRC